MLASVVLRPQESEWHDGDPIGAPVGLTSSRQHHRIEQRVADPLAEPVQVTHVRIRDGPTQLDRDAEDPLVVALNDEVDLTLATPRSEVGDGRLGSLGEDANRQGREGLEQRTQQGSSRWAAQAGATPGEQTLGPDAEEPCRQGRVDPSLVIHYFGSKDGLLGAVMAWPVDLDEIEEQVLAPGLDGVGERLVRFLLAQWDDPSKRHPLTVIMRNAMGHDEAARLLTEFVRRELVGRIVPLMGEATAELRGSFIASTLVGLAMTRYVVRLEPLASAPADVVVAAMAPVIERLLTCDLAEG